MDIGMLWFDNDKFSTVSEKIRRAMNYYQKKYEISATICYINPSMIDSNENFPIKVVDDEMILKNHFWLGVEDE